MVLGDQNCILRDIDCNEYDCQITFNFDNLESMDSVSGPRDPRLVTFANTLERLRSTDRNCNFVRQKSSHDKVVDGVCWFSRAGRGFDTPHDQL